MLERTVPSIPNSFRRGQAVPFPAHHENGRGRKMQPRDFPAARIAKRNQVCKLAILGFGTVGRAVARILSERFVGGLRISHVFNRDVSRKRVDWLPAEVGWTDQFNCVLNSDADVVVELAGGVKPAEDWIRSALLAGKSVVTANKQLIAQCGPQLQRLAAEQGCRLAFGAAVAGGVPVISAIQDGLAGDEIVKITGILNGTCNYILNEMERSGMTFSTALGEAQKRGYAEADPTEDIHGQDARAKLVILARVGMHANIAPDQISCRSISHIEWDDFEYAKQLGFTIRQVSTAELDGETLLASVQPALVRLASPFALTGGCQNLVASTGRFGGETMFQGEGAGGDPTAVAVISDVLAIARGQNAALNGYCNAHEISPRVSSDFVSEHYVRFRTKEKRIMTGLSRAIETAGVRIKAVMERPRREKHETSFAFTVVECKLSALERALRKFARLRGPESPIYLPILN